MKLSIFNLFKKKPVPKIESVNLTTIDTSFINVPKLKEFSKEEQKQILNCFRQLNSKKYDVLIKFSADLADRYTKEQEILAHTMDRYNYTELEKNQPKLDSDIYNYINESIISEYEYKITINNINEIRKELYVRLTALDIFIRKEKRKKLNPFSVFYRAEKMEYIENLSRRISERDRIKQLIKQNTIISIMIHRRLEERKQIQKQSELYKQYETIINNSNNYETKIKEHLATIINQTKNLLLTECGIDKDFINKIGNQVIKKQIEEYTPFHQTNNSYLIKSIDLEMGLTELELGYSNTAHDWYKIINLLNDRNLKELYLILAEYLHKYEEYYLEHKNDYKIYLKELTDIVDKYEHTRTIEWDADYLEKTHQDYQNKIINYLKLFNDYIPQDKLKEIYDKLDRLLWLYQLKTNYCYGERINWYPIANELLTKLEDKYGIKFPNKLTEPNGGMLNKKNYIIDNLYMFRTVYDLLNGYWEDVDINYGLEKDENKQYSSLYYNKKTVFTASDCYHIEDLYNKDLLFNGFSFDDAMDKKHYDRYIKFKVNSIFDHDIYFGKILEKNISENYCDNRLIYIPKVLNYTSLNENFFCLLFDHMYMQDETYRKMCDVKGVYIESEEVLYRTVVKILRNKKASKFLIYPKKYIFVKEGVLKNGIYNTELYHRLKEFFKLENEIGDLKTYTIDKENNDILLVTIPDDYEYSDISSSLDSLLEKKVLKKKAN